MGGLAWVSDFFKRIQVWNKKKIFFLFLGEGKGRLASVSEFVLQRIQITKENGFWEGERGGG